MFVVINKGWIFEVPRTGTRNGIIGNWILPGIIMFRCDAAFDWGTCLFAANITVRCTFEINLAILFYQYSGALHL
jgi:hypothetical protein